MTKLTDSLIQSLGANLYDIKFPISLPGGIVITLKRIENTDVVIGAFTAFDGSGVKTERALPFNKYINVINELEDVLSMNSSTNDLVFGRVVGWNPTPVLKNFLLDKHIHRLFFLKASDVGSFLMDYTSKNRVAYRKNTIGVNVLVTVG